MEALSIVSLRVWVLTPVFRGYEPRVETVSLPRIIRGLRPVDYSYSPYINLLYAAGTLMVTRREHDSLLPR